LKSLARRRLNWIKKALELKVKSRLNGLRTKDYVYYLN
jgi:hypothetical protein